MPEEPKAPPESSRLRIERRLNLDLPEDRQELIVACKSVPALGSLAEDHISDLLKWFRAPEWHTVYSGGMMTGPEPHGRHPRPGSSIERLIEVTAKLRLLRGYPGFEKLVASLNNPSQVYSTIFEIDVATWCMNCRNHISLSFSPAIAKRAGVKYPDFLWQTSLGDLYCECKQLNMWQRTETQRASALMSRAAEAMGDSQLWPTDVRMEILIHGHFKGGSEARLKTIVEQQASEMRRGLRPSHFQDETFTVAIRDRAIDPLGMPDSINMYQVQVGDTPVQINDFHNAHLMVTKSTGFARARALRDFVKEAKKQLPDDRPGGIFIEMPSGIDMASEKLQEMLRQPAHQVVVWASIWTGGIPARAVWREGQGFDARLIEQKPGNPNG
jgi:hypothetical protein